MLKTSLLLLFLIFFSTTFTQSFIDSTFQQPISKKYLAYNHTAQWSKIGIDRDQNVYALSEEGLYWIVNDQLVKDQRFLPLQAKIPIDFYIQEDEQILYYLYEDHYLSNAHAGQIYGGFEKGKFHMMAVNKDGEVLLAGLHEIQIVQREQKLSIHVPEEIKEVKASGEDFFIQTSEGLLKLKDGAFQYLIKLKDILSWTMNPEVIYISTPQGIMGISNETGETIFQSIKKLPVVETTTMRFYQDQLWVGTEMGAYSTSQFEKFKYYQSERWLLNDSIIDLAVHNDGHVFILTREGISEIHFEDITLEEKANYFHNKVRKRHLRLGLIGETRLQKKGDITTAELIDTDNDGLWTSFYLGSEVFRYATTKDPAAKKNALESFESYQRLLSINQLKGFPSRTFARKGFKVSDPDRWRDSPYDQWEWKGHTSSDEFVAYIWVAGILYKHLDLNPSEKQMVSDFIDAILTHIIENDYYFVDIDGKPTLWGRWNPEYINWYPKTVVDRKLGSVTIIAGLQLAYELTGKQIYRDEAYRLFEEHGYLENIQIPYDQITYTPNVIYEGHNMGMGGWNHSDDEMSFLTYWILYHFAFNQDLKKIYTAVINDHWQIEKPERNSLWNLITFGTTGNIDLPSVKWHLRAFQMDMIRWSIKNSHRKDLQYLDDNFRGQSISEVLSPDERPVMRYNGNPFNLDGGRDGYRELAGDEYLLPYWMGRYLQVIVSQK